MSLVFFSCIETCYCTQVNSLLSLPFVVIFLSPWVCCPHTSVLLQSLASRWPHLSRTSLAFVFHAIHYTISRADKDDGGVLHASSPRKVAIALVSFVTEAESIVAVHYFCVLCAFLCLLIDARSLLLYESHSMYIQYRPTWSLKC